MIRLQGPARAKATRQECTWCARGTERRLMWLEWRGVVIRRGFPDGVNVRVRGRRFIQDTEPLEVCH